MNDALKCLSAPAISSEVHDFAVEKGVSGYLGAVVDLARQAFLRPRYIALDVEVGGQATEELLAGQRSWSAAAGMNPAARGFPKWRVTRLRSRIRGGTGDSQSPGDTPLRYARTRTCS